MRRRLDRASSGQEACAPILNEPATQAHAHAHAGRGHAPATGKELKIDSKVERVEKIEKGACLKEARARAAEEQAMRWAAANAAADPAHPPNRAAQAARRREAAERQRKIGGHAGKMLALAPGVAGVSIGTSACKERTHACQETC